MNNLELINFIEKNTKNNAQKIVIFFKSFGVKLEYLPCTVNEMIHFSLGSIGKLSYYVKSDNSKSKNPKKIEKEIENTTELLEIILSIIDEETRKKIENYVLKKIGKTKEKNRSRKMDFVLNNILNNNNYISINNTIDLKSYIKISNNIENKQDVLNLIDEMEKAQKDNKPKDYIEKLSKLLEIVKNAADITPLVIKGINWLMQFL
ncbi:hypothetical protein R4J03_11605 [Brachyspira intermedia]|uniref:hypothetical protein n=1 Tax=Brachyspira intermedia TaxID=84377 RepID=UPI0030060266